MNAKYPDFDHCIMIIEKKCLFSKERHSEVFKGGGVLSATYSLMV